MPSFVVGTGAEATHGFGPPLTGSEVRDSGTFGLLQLTLRATGYDWVFVPQAGRAFTDTGSGDCH